MCVNCAITSERAHAFVRPLDSQLSVCPSLRPPVCARMSSRRRRPSSPPLSPPSGSGAAHTKSRASNDKVFWRGKERGGRKSESACERERRKCEQETQAQRTTVFSWRADVRPKPPGASPLPMYPTQQSALVVQYLLMKYLGSDDD